MFPEHPHHLPDSHHVPSASLLVEFHLSSGVDSVRFPLVDP